MKAALIVIVADLALLSALPLLSSSHEGGPRLRMQASDEADFAGDQSLLGRVKDLKEQNAFLVQQANDAKSEAILVGQRLIEAKAEIDQAKKAEAVALMQVVDANAKADEAKKAEAVALTQVVDANAKADEAKKAEAVALTQVVDANAKADEAKKAEAVALTQAVDANAKADEAKKAEAVALTQAVDANAKADEAKKAEAVALTQAVDANAKADEAKKAEAVALTQAVDANAKADEAKKAEAVALTQAVDANAKADEAKKAEAVALTQAVDANAKADEAKKAEAVALTQAVDANAKADEAKKAEAVALTQAVDANAKADEAKKAEALALAQAEKDEAAIAGANARIQKLAALTSITVRVAFDRGLSISNPFGSAGMITLSAPLIQFRDQTIIPIPCQKMEALKDATSIVTISANDVWGHEIQGEASLVASELDPRICGIRIDIPSSDADSPNIDKLAQLSHADLIKSQPSTLQIVYYEHNSERSWQVDTKLFMVQSTAAFLTYEPGLFRTMYNSVFGDNAIGAYALTMDGQYVCMIVSLGFCEMLDYSQVGSFKPIASSADFGKIAEKMRQREVLYSKCSGQQECQFTP